MKPKLPRAVARPGKYFQTQRKDLHEETKILSDDPSGLSTGPRLTGHEEQDPEDIIEALRRSQLKLDEIADRYGQPRRRFGHVPFLVKDVPAIVAREAGWKPGLPGEGAQGEHPPMQKLACEMIHPGHPDDLNGEKPCLLDAVATTADGVNVCRECALGQLREGFAVFWIHWNTTRKLECIFPFAHVGDRFRFDYPEEPEFSRELTVVRINGFQPEDTVFFDDHSYCKQKHIKLVERLT